MNCADKVPKAPADARGLRRWLPTLFVTAFGLWLLGPVARGNMPLSADHTVHLSRAWMLGQELRAGHVSGWSDSWFFGFPLGELYPPLGDILVNATHAIGFGAIPWPMAYAFAFSLVFILQGWVMLSVGRRMGMGPIPGVIAAFLILADPGFSREGGWMYTVYFGVWPQVFATSLAWLGFAKLADNALTTDLKGVVGAGLCFGAALLAHPITMLMLAVGAPLFALTMGLRPPPQHGQPSVARWSALRRCGIRMGIAIAIGVSVSAWWLVPMLTHKGWMASYGWLFVSFSRLVHWALDGQWTQRMPAAVGYSAAMGIVWISLRGKGFARFVVVFALVQWSCAASEFFWIPRLDRLSEGFTHLQYQRFLIAAKPGFYLAAGSLVATLANLGLQRWRAHGHKSTGAIGLCAALASLIWIVNDNHAAMRQHGVGKIQTQRIVDDPGFEYEYPAFLHWARARWEERDRDYRIAFKAHRNAHWFMDAIVTTHTPMYKIGFTPGDNFVHKPESSRAAVLDAIGVRYVVSRHAGARSLPGEIARFGDIRVVERAQGASREIAWIVGAPANTDPKITVLEGSARQGFLRVRVDGLGESRAQLVFAIAGYPRWEITGGEWYETPIWGDAAPVHPEQRDRGELRGGRALGDDGSEPTLITTDVDGDGVIELRYRRRSTRDVLATLWSLVVALICLLWLHRGRRSRLAPIARLARRLRSTLTAAVGAIERLAHPAAVALLLVALVVAAGVRWSAAARDESLQAVGWVAGERVTRGHRVRTGPLKTEMLLRPAVLLSRSRNNKVVFPRVMFQEQLRGWIAIDDDAAKARSNGKLAVKIEVRGSDGAWATLLEMPLRHRPGRVMLNIDTAHLAGTRGDLRLTTTKSGARAPRAGFDLQLGSPLP